jgi:protein-disulfide isomerase
MSSLSPLIRDSDQIEESSAMSCLCLKNVNPALALALLLSSASAFPQEGPAKSRPRAVDISAPKVVATFNGASVTEEDLRKAAAAGLDELSIQVNKMNANVARMEHRILETSLLHLLADKLFEAEAAKQHLTKEAFLEKELRGKVKEPSEQDIAAFYGANKQRFSSPLEKVSGQIRQYLAAQNREKAVGDLADRLKADYDVKMLLPPLREDVKSGGSPSKGQLGAPITIVEFSDFECPACAQLARTLQEVSDKYGDRVLLIFRQFPLVQIHPLAEKAAEASLCAAEQNRFWELHDLMFESQSTLEETDLKAKAAKLKLDGAAFDKCLVSGKYAARIRQDQRDGLSLGVDTSPSFFINGRYFTGAVPSAEITKVIEQELALSNYHASAEAGRP